MGKNRVVLLLLLGLGLVGCGSASDSAEFTDSADLLPQLFEAPEFTLTDQQGNRFGKADLLGKVWLVDFIFTRCGGPCPLMAQLMKGVQDRLGEAGLAGDSDHLQLVSITVDPEFDTPEVLAAYAELWQADTRIWSFLTGPPETVTDVVRNGFKITLEREGSGTMPGMSSMPNIVHGTSFLLVDKSGWIRRIFRMDEPDFDQAVVRDAQKLLDE